MDDASPKQTRRRSLPSSSTLLHSLQTWSQPVDAQSTAASTLSAFSSRSGRFLRDFSSRSGRC